MHAKYRLSSRIQIFLLIVAIVPVLVVSTTIVWKEYDANVARIAALQEELTDIYKQQVKRQVDRMVTGINGLIQDQEDRIAQYARQQTDMAYTLIQQLPRDGADGAASRQEALRILRSLRFYGEQGYVFIINMDGVAELIGDRSELEGMDLTDYHDTEGRYFIQEMIAIARDQGEGYCQYTWSKPGVEGTDYGKLSYIRYYEPFDWIVGSGFYWDDLEAEVQDEALNLISSDTLTDQFVFAGRFDGTVLLGPSQGRNMINVTDRNGVAVVHEMIRTAREGGGYVPFAPVEMEGAPSMPSISYVRRVEPWGWYVGAGLFLENMEDYLANQQMANRAAQWRHILILLTMIISFGMLAFILALHVGRTIMEGIETFIGFFNQVGDELTLIDTQRFRFQEFEALALSANAMITGRQKVEQARIESERRYRTLIDNIPQNVFLKDRNSTFISCNRSLAEELGIEPEEIVGKDDFDFFPADLAQKYRIDDERIMVAGVVEDIEEGNQVGDCQRYVHVTKAPVRDERQQVIGILGLYWDITDRKEAEERLRMNETLLNQAQRIARFGHWEWEVESGQRLWSESLWRILGRSPEEEDNLAAEDILQQSVHATDRTTRLHAVQDITDGAGDSFAVEYRIVRPDGGVRHIRELGEVIPTAFDQPMKILGVVHDITERKLYEETLKQGEEEARAMSRHLMHLLEVANTLSEAGTLDDLSRLAVQAGKEKLRYDRLSIWFCDRKNREIRGAYRIDETGFITDERSSSRILGVDDPINRVIDYNRLYVSPEGSDLHDGDQRVVGKGTFLIAPLWDGVQVVGILAADNLLTQAPFTESRIRILELYASTIGHLYSLKQAQEVIRRQSDETRLLGERLMALHEVSNLLLAISDQEQLCRQAIEKGHIALGVDRMEIWFWNEDEETFSGAFGMDRQGNVRDQRQISIPARQFPQALRMIRDGVSVRLEPNLDLHFDGDTSGPRSCGLALMTYGRQVIGLICVDNLMSRLPLQESQTQALVLLSDFIGHQIIRLRNASLRHGLESQSVSAAASVDLVMPTGAGRQERRVIQLAPVLQDMQAMIRDMTPAHISLQWDLPMAPTPVLGDAREARQMTLHLLANAIESMGDQPGTITISVDVGHFPIETKNGETVVMGPIPEGKGIRLTIADDGAGIARENLNRVFSPGFTTRTPGRGWGATVALEIARRFGGGMILRSAPDQGAAFVALMPIASGEVGERT